MAETPNLKLPLLDSSADVSEDHQKINQFVEALDARLGEVATQLAGLAQAGHAHELDGINGLTEALQSKAAAAHQHALNDLSDVSVADAPEGKVLGRVAGGLWGLLDKGVSLAELNSQMSTKADTSHSHATSDIADLQTALNAARDAAVAIVMGGATPAQLDTLKELAAALQDNDSEIAAIVSSLASKATLVSPNFTGTPKIASNDIVHAGNILSLASDAAASSYAEASSNITPSFATKVNQHYRIDANLTINNPTGMKPGMSGVFLLFATADRVVSWGNKWIFPDNEVPEVKNGTLMVSWYIENANKIRTTYVSMP